MIIAKMKLSKIENISKQYVDIQHYYLENSFFS